jgi:hypothetical protein
MSKPNQFEPALGTFLVKAENLQQGMVVTGIVTGLGIAEVHFDVVSVVLYPNGNFYRVEIIANDGKNVFGAHKDDMYQVLDFNIVP